MKLAWDVPRDTYTYVVENCLAQHYVPLRKQICSRYANFFQKLFRSSSKEIRHLANIVSRDAKSTFYRNVQFVKEAAGLSPWDFTSKQIANGIENAPIPPNNEWRMTLLVKLLTKRRQMTAAMEDSKVAQMVDSLCNT